MKFYRISDVPIQSDDLVFKASPVSTGIAMVVFLAIAITTLLLGIFRVDGITAPAMVFYIVAAFSMLFGLIAFRSFRASLKSSNWLMRCHRTGLFIHFRSYLNWKIPNDDAQVAGFDYAEIAWIKIVKETRTSPGLGGNQRKQIQQLTFLQLGLRNPDTKALEEQLQREMNCRPSGIIIDLDYPVQVLAGGIVELLWSGIRPSARKAIECFPQNVKVTEVESRKTDRTHTQTSLGMVS